MVIPRAFLQERYRFGRKLFAAPPNFLAKNSSQCSSQSGFTMVNVTDSTNVYVRFVTFPFFP